ncbi:carcinoembryonic antigen-related cell adhesion molecule 21-like [Artibeus jamaicensis]|uniref:carcinoembryonic antigen-related cell adhesion molecule 21-like n=1 Tax=Artibeus jamaicensis TaxID=9417 RepID=UPI00235A83DE|nr:carcinoembryonic antigen-related cell adhesion molecule 21-like [Artibeus jamaicensis]
MGFLSVSSHRGLVHWQGPLLVVLLLTFWSPPTSAKISVESNHTEKGKDVLLRMFNKPPEVLGIVWYKGHISDSNNVIAFFMVDQFGEYLSGPGDHGLGVITDDGSLLLKNATTNETGMYTVVVHLPKSEIYIGSALLFVYEYKKGPFLHASMYWATENKNAVVLTCYTDLLSIKWMFNGVDLKFTKRIKLSGDSRRLTIDPVMREDAGFYKCVASNAFRRDESRSIELHVLHE